MPDQQPCKVPGSPDAADGSLAVLQGAFCRVLAGQTNPEDLNALRGLLGGRNVQVQGNADGATIVTGDGNIVLPGADAATVKVLLDRLYLPRLHQLRPPTKTFVGRERELETLLGGVAKGGAAISGLRGMGGIGKTELALIAAERLKSRFPDAQILLDMQGTNPIPLSPEDALSRAIHAFHPEAHLPEALAELQAFYRSVLDGKRVLILADNAASAGQILPLIPPAGSCLLITSRSRFELKDWVTVDVSVLPEEEARNLLRDLAPRLDEKEAAELAQACGYLPLALCLAGGALRARPEINSQEYLGKLRQAGERLSQLDKYKHLTTEEMGIERSLALSYELLPPDLQAFFGMLSVFPASFDAAAAAAVTATDAGAAAERLGDLWTYSLMEGDATVRGRYWLHDLASEFAAAKLDDGERATAAQRHSNHFVGLLCHADELYCAGGEHVVEGLSLFDLERANIDAGQAWAAAHMELDDEAARLCSNYSGTGVYCVNLRLHPQRERIPWLRAALKAARKLENFKAEGWHLGNLGLAHATLGEPRKAIEFYDQQLKIVRRIGDRRGEGSALGNLGLAYADLSEVRKAIKFHEESLAIARELGDNRGVGNAFGNLGSAYGRLSDFRKAIEFNEHQLEVVRRIGDRRGEGSALCNLGSGYAHLGNVHKAVELHRQALAISREIGDKYGEGTVLGCLGGDYADLRDFGKAIEFDQQYLTVACEIGDRRAEGAALNSLGCDYLSLGEFRKAIEFYERQLRIVHEIGDRRCERSALGNLGSAYLKLDDVHKAIGFYQESLALTREIGDRRGEATDLWNMAMAHEKLHDLAHAIPFAQAALAIFEEIADHNAEKVRMWLSPRTKRT